MRSVLPRARLSATRFPEEEDELDDLEDDELDDLPDELDDVAIQINPCTLAYITLSSRQTK
jgi:hypothetical protein